MAKVAVIEDDQPIAQMYAFKLTNSGFTVKTAFDGVSGLALLQQFHPDLILLDIMMPQMTGDEMLKKLRQTKWGKDIKVIVLTNISQDEAPESLHSLAVDQYIVKAHYTPSQVVDTVKAILKLSK